MSPSRRDFLAGPQRFWRPRDWPDWIMPRPGCRYTGGPTAAPSSAGCSWTRRWFAWANTPLGELIVGLHRRDPMLLR